MPIYEYKCNTCGHKVEKLVKSNDVKAKLCPKCFQSGYESYMSKVPSRVGSIKVN